MAFDLTADDSKISSGWAAVRRFTQVAPENRRLAEQAGMLEPTPEPTPEPSGGGGLFSIGAGIIDVGGKALDITTGSDIGTTVTQPIVKTVRAADTAVPEINIEMPPINLELPDISYPVGSLFGAGGLGVAAAVDSTEEGGLIPKIDWGNVGISLAIGAGALLLLYFLIKRK